MRVTREWIDKFKTARGGWTKKQLAVIGVPWPPERGWKDRATGTKIDAAAQAQFEAGAEAPAQSSVLEWL